MEEEKVQTEGRYEIAAPPLWFRRGIYLSAPGRQLSHGKALGPGSFVDPDPSLGYTTGPFAILLLLD